MMFCGKCKSVKTPIRTPKGIVWVCPKCTPQKVVKPWSGHDYIRKRGVPCLDRQLCKPAECAISLDCQEGKK